MHKSSFIKMHAFANVLRQRRGNDPLTIVDYGSQDINGSYKSLFAMPSWRYVGIDMSPGANVDVVLADPYDWKELGDGSIDVFISGQAFEHTEYLWLTMMEVERVLKPTGLACIITPSAGPEHRYPVDCWRIYPDGMRALAKFAGLETIDVFTEWNPQDYADDSYNWKDSRLLARKRSDMLPADRAGIDLVREALKNRVRQLAGSSEPTQVLGM
jgi:SAM-dependent methyltransferase